MIFAARPVSILWLGFAVLSAPAFALPMTPEECDRARVEQSSLDKSGVNTDISRGAAWGRENLSQQRLGDVKRWLELEEQIQFRCPRPKPRLDPAAVAQPNEPEAASKTTAKPKKLKAEQKAKSEAAAAEPEASDAAVVAKPSKRKAQPTIKKPRPDDAYQPPAPFSGDIQHAVPGLSQPASSGTGLAP